MNQLDASNKADSSSKKRTREEKSCVTLTQSSKRHCTTKAAAISASEKITNDSEVQPLKPHPCLVQPPPEEDNITCLMQTFLVDTLPENYPYLPFPVDILHFFIQ
ncbi:hypothetical protein R3P38DRAFT_2730637, partial [Favolaschia claudopus]